MSNHQNEDFNEVVQEQRLEQAYSYFKMCGFELELEVESQNHFIKEGRTYFIMNSELLKFAEEETIPDESEGLTEEQLEAEAQEQAQDYSDELWKQIKEQGGI